MWQIQSLSPQQPMGGFKAGTATTWYKKATRCSTLVVLNKVVIPALVFKILCTGSALQASKSYFSWQSHLVGYWSPHFQDEKTKAQRKCAACPGSSSCRAAGRQRNPSLPDCTAMMSFSSFIYSLASFSDSSRCAHDTPQLSSRDLDGRSYSALKLPTVLGTLGSPHEIHPVYCQIERKRGTTPSGGCVFITGNLQPSPGLTCS